jgi:hypothetical protein
MKSIIADSSTAIPVSAPYLARGAPTTLVAVVFEGVAVGIAKIDGTFAASSLDGYSVFFELFLKTGEAGSGGLEPEVFQGVSGENSVLGANEVDEIPASRGPKENHVRRDAKCDLQAENFRVELLGPTEVASPERDVK